MAWRRAISSPGLEYSLRGGLSFSNARLILHYVFPQEEEKAAREILLGAFEIADGIGAVDYFQPKCFRMSRSRETGLSTSSLRASQILSVKNWPTETNAPPTATAVKGP